MKKYYAFTLAISLTFAFSNLLAQTIWDGPDITFTKADGVDWTMEANQDRIVDTIWITRANNKGVFNIAQEDAYQGDGDQNFGPSPVDTEWAFGRTSDGIENLTFTTWIVATTEFDPDNLATPPDLVGKEMVLHLISYDVYMDIKFLSWAVGDNGGMGGFSYERATEQPTGVSEAAIEKNKELVLFPNPSSDYIQISELGERQKVEIFNSSGIKVFQKSINYIDKIDINPFPTGIYYIRLEDGRKTSFLKE